MIRFETKPPTPSSGQPSVTWGPWRKPVCVVSIQATFTAEAIVGTRTVRIEVRNVNTPVQQFFSNGPDATSTTAGVIHGITAFHGAGPSNIYTAGAENQNGQWQVSLPQWLIIPPSYVIVLLIDGNENGDTLSSLVIGLDDILEFRP